MAMRDAKSARAIAAEVLREFAATRDYAGPILDRLLNQTEEKQRATDLVYGTLRNLNALDAVIAKFSGRQTARIDPPLLSILRIGVYELVYSPATPVYSVVNEAVRNVEDAGGKKQTGFVNAVLRQIERHITDRQIDLTQTDPRRTLVQSPQSGCQFDTDLLPDPATSLQLYLSTCFSLPSWLIGEWLEQFGPDQTRWICLACNRRPSLYVRANPLRTTAQDLVTQFEQAGVRAQAVPSTVGWAVPTTSATVTDAGLPTSLIKIVGPHAVTQLPGFAEGLFTVQDLSAARAVRILDPQPGWSILDLCSAPGTKTTQLAEATRDSARILATDINPERLDRVRENITRLGLASVTIIPYAQLEQGQAESFDAILLDAPCSNTGVLARRVEARYRLRRKAVQELAATQKALLAKAAGLVKPGGRICYSTCSIQRQENQDVREFLTPNNRFELVREELTLPSAEPFDHDGSFVALLKRRS
ncbi:MAG: methyltransferase domain-containing protein [Planctomycetes bacterium]|nr:methyltransferase domain-containing protein [Planctomycetota bacterium]